MWKCPITHTGDGLAGGRKWPLAFSPARGLSTSKSDSHLHDKGNELPEKQWHWHRLNQHQLGEELVLYVPVTDASFITVATAARSTPEASGCRPQTGHGLSYLPVADSVTSSAREPFLPSREKQLE